jgi:hypothetical protein
MTLKRALCIIVVVAVVVIAFIFWTDMSFVQKLKTATTIHSALP